VKRELAFFLIFFSVQVALAAEADLASLPLPENPSSFNRIRVAILQNKDQVTLFADAPYRVEAMPNRALIDRGLRLSETKITARGRGIRFGAKDFHFPGIRVMSDNGSIRVDSRNYREGVQILRDSHGKLMVVNELEVEDYLKGVLPSEMPHRWQEEALKAQAVASRTFAMFKALAKKNEDYMLAGDVIGQVYGGHGAEHAATDRVVDETRGEILTFREQIFPAYFHSTCAGQTTHPEYNWDIEPHPALQGVKCFYCLKSKYQRWEKAVSISDMERKLKLAGYRVGAISQIIPGKWDASGRAREIVIRHAGGSLVLRANDFRLAVGPDVVKSLKDLQVIRRGSRMTFAGRGWGHGVGMCQWGAKTLAEQGKTYREILEFYYPGAKITRIRGL